MELTDHMVASLEDFLQNDIDGKLRQEIITSLAALQQRLTVEAQKLQSPQNFKAIDAAIQAAQSAMLVMMMIENEPHAGQQRRTPCQTCEAPG